MLAAGLTAEQLARALSVQLLRVNQTLTGSRSIGPEMAVRLAYFFGGDPKRWLQLQNDYDLARVPWEQIKREITPLPKAEPKEV